MTVATLLAAGLRLFSPLGDSRRVNNAVAPGGGYTAGQIVLHEGVVGVPFDDIAATETGVLIIRADEIEVDCAALGAGAYAVGQKVYFDVADAEVNQTASGNYYCGTVVEQPATGAEKVKIALVGDVFLAIGV